MSDRTAEEDVPEGSITWDETLPPSGSRSSMLRSSIRGSELRRRHSRCRRLGLLGLCRGTMRAITDRRTSEAEEAAAVDRRRIGGSASPRGSDRSRRGGGVTRPPFTAPSPPGQGHSREGGSLGDRGGGPRHRAPPRRRHRRRRRPPGDRSPRDRSREIPSRCPRIWT